MLHVVLTPDTDGIEMTARPIFINRQHAPVLDVESNTQLVVGTSYPRRFKEAGDQEPGRLGAVW